METIKQFFKDLLNTVFATIKLIVLFIAAMDIWFVLIYGFDLVKLIIMTIVCFIMIVIMFAVILLINTAKYGNITKIENEKGRYSDEYYQALEDVINKTNKPNKWLQKVNLLIFLASHYLEGGRNEKALETLRRIEISELAKIPDEQPIKAVYYCVLIGIMIRKDDIASAITVCEQNKRLFDRHISNLRYGQSINYCLCLIEFHKGNYSTAIKEIEERVYKKDAIDKVCEYLLCYRCAKRMNEMNKADEYMKKAENELEKCKWFHKEIMSEKIAKLKENELEYKF